MPPDVVPCPLPTQVALEVIAFATPPEKLAELRSMFVTMDADRNGTISVDEFKKAMGYSDLAELHLEVQLPPRTCRRRPHAHTQHPFRARSRAWIDGWWPMTALGSSDGPPAAPHPRLPVIPQGVLLSLHPHPHVHPGPLPQH